MKAPATALAIVVSTFLVQQTLASPVPASPGGESAIRISWFRVDHQPSHLSWLSFKVNWMIFAFDRRLTIAHDAEIDGGLADRSTVQQLEKMLQGLTISNSE